MANTEKMNDSTANFTSPETAANSTTSSTGLMEILTLCVYSINFLFGFPTHSYVMWLIITGTSGIASKFFILNLSVCEIGNSLNCLVFILSSCLSLTLLPLFLLGLVFTGRPLFHCLMCVELYLAVVHPVTFLKYKPLRYRVICCTLAWIITIGACFLCIFKGLVHAQFLSMQFLLFLSIQLFCLMAVHRALKQSGPGERKREREEENNMTRRAFHIILISTVSTAIIYFPFAVSGLVTILTNHSVYSLWLTGLVCYVLAGFVQPVLHLHRNGKLYCLCASLLL